jgi:hypothetical protein
MSGSQSEGGSVPSRLTIGTSALGGSLLALLTADDIVPGSTPSYQLCKTIYLYHPLGMKMAEAPINLAQSQQREIKVEGAPDRIADAFVAEWKAIGADKIIHNTAKQSRIYGIASVVLGAEKVPSNEPFPPEKLSTEELFFNVLDPLNTAGSLVLDQDPNSPTFQKTTQVTTNGETYHRSRVCIVMNEEPIYISYTSSAFGFVGRSVYQRSLYPLKSFVQSMVTDDMITRKAGVLVAKMEAPGSIIDRMMQTMMGLKRALLAQAKTDNVLGIGITESIETLNLNNIDGAGTFARTNILKNAATAADMPAVLLENETMVQGFGEGTEDAKNIARYIDRVRDQMSPLYDFFDPIVQRRAWNPEFYKAIQQSFPEEYGKVKYEAALAKWQNAFKATWPSLMKEPDSERVKVDDIKLRAAVAVFAALNQGLDPDNKARLVAWVADSVTDTELLFSSPLVLDIDALRDYEPPQPGMGGPPGSEGGGGEEKGEDGKANVMPFKLGGAS